jgi:hypothetical protein
LVVGTVFHRVNADEEAFGLIGHPRDEFDDTYWVEITGYQLLSMQE